jgi:hypothetical protein
VFIIIIVLVTLLTAALPVIAPRIAHKMRIPIHHAPVWLPLVAAIIYFGSLYVPDIHISMETSTFQEHFLGGVYTAILYVYFTQLFGWRRHWLVMLVGLYAWTSSLGVANEILEFALTKLDIQHINISDTSWDLVANTVGSFTAYALLRLFARLGLLR